MKIYTKTGDHGQSSLLSGQRVEKSNPRLKAYGDVDELNSALGWCLAEVAKWTQLEPLTKSFPEIQSNLFVIGSHLACDDSRIATQLPSLGPKQVTLLEEAMDQMDHELAPLKNFILPGGAESACRLHLARTICRRAERSCAELKAEMQSDHFVYLNRLSDYLFVAARFANLRLGISESVWSGKKE